MTTAQAHDLKRQSEAFFRRPEPHNDNRRGVRMAVIKQRARRHWWRVILNQWTRGA